MAVLVTFALGTATGDWTLELTGWGPSKAVLLPLALIAIVALAWRLGANAVLTFWLAYILTRPLGANIGDWLATPSSEKGLGLGTFVTSIIFLAAILVTVVYLSISRADVIENTRRPSHRRLLPTGTAASPAEGLGGGSPGDRGTARLGEQSAAPERPGLKRAPRPAARARRSTRPRRPSGSRRSYPPTRCTNYRTIAQDTLELVDSGDQAGAASRVTDLETAWDDDQGSLQPTDCQTWAFVDQQIDPVLSAVRASNPDTSSEDKALRALLVTLGQS